MPTASHHHHHHALAHVMERPCTYSYISYVCPITTVSNHTNIPITAPPSNLAHWFKFNQAAHIGERLPLQKTDVPVLGKLKETVGGYNSLERWIFKAWIECIWNGGSGAGFFCPKKKFLAKSTKSYQIRHRLSDRLSSSNLECSSGPTIPTWSPIFFPQYHTNRPIFPVSRLAFNGPTPHGYIWLDHGV